MTLVPDSPAPSTSETRSAGSSYLTIGFVLVALAFTGTWVTFPAVWLDNRTHGFMAAGLAAWMLWTHRHALRVHESAPIFALPLIAAASLFWAVGQIVSAQVVHQFAVPAVLWLWLLAVRGERAAMTAVPALLVFSLALPVWEVLMWPLQLAAATVSAIVTKIVGVEAVVSQEVIKLKWGMLVVAGSCSGLGFFLTAITLSCAYSMLFVRTRAVQWRIVAVAAAMAVLANWVRVVGLVLIADATHMTSPLMKNHEMFGWGIFFGAMLIWFFLADRIVRSEPHRTSFPLPAVTLAGDGLGPNHIASAAWWVLPLATLLAVAGPMFLYGVRLIPNTTKPPERIRGIAAGPAFGTPSADLAAISAAAWRPAFEAPAFSRTIAWTSGTDTVLVDQLAYFEEHQGAELIGDANRVAPDSVLLQDRQIGPLDANMRTVRQAVIREGLRARVVWYWYRVAGIETSSSGRAKLLSLLAFLQREEGGEATFVSVPCRGGDCSAATSLLYHFVTGKQLPSSTTSGGD
jgi:exosortase